MPAVWFTVCEGLTTLAQLRELVEICLCAWAAADGDTGEIPPSCFVSGADSATHAQLRESIELCLCACAAGTENMPAVWFTVCEGLTTLAQLRGLVEICLCACAAADGDRGEMPPSCFALGLGLATRSWGALAAELAHVLLVEKRLFAPKSGLVHSYG